MCSVADLGFSCLLAFSAQAAGSWVALDSNTQVLDSRFQILRDPSRSMTLADVQAHPEDFHPSMGRSSLHLGYTPDAVWLKLVIYSTEKTPVQRILNFEYAYLDDLTLYQVSDTGISVMHSGYEIPVAERAMHHRRPAFPLVLPPQRDVTFYIRVVTNGSMTLDAWLSPVQSFHQFSYDILLLLAIYYGMLLALGLYNLFMFLVLREKAFLFYACFALSFGVAAFSTNGLAPLYFWPEWGNGVSRVIPSGFIMATLWAVVFARYFLNLSDYVPRLDQLLKRLIWIWWAMLALSLLVSVQSALKIMSLMGVSTAILMFVMGVVGIYKKVPASGYFMLAWLCLFIGTTLVSIRNLGWIPSNFFTVFSMQMGSAIEMLLLSFGLASRFNALKRQKLLAQEKLVNMLKLQEAILERRVSERTAALEKAREQLEQRVVEDALTGVLNRHGLQLKFSQLKAESPQALAIVLIDLDGFKPINDRYGHEAGDELLHVIAQRLSQCVDDQGIVARLGGDEFVVVTTMFTLVDDLRRWGAQLLNRVGKEILLSTGQTVEVKASIGIWLTVAVQATTLKQGLRCADQAMYQVKHSGKDGVVVKQDLEGGARP